MTKRLRTLVLEDNAVDAEIIIRELRRAGFDPEWKRIETEADFLDALETPPELILSDYGMPHFDGLRAVILLRERGLDIPFILISGTIGEDAAVEAMRQGATDYLLKDRIARLGPAVERALDAKRLRDEQQQAEQEKRSSDERFRQLAETIEEVFWITDAKKHLMLYVSPAYEKIWGRSCQSLYTQPHTWLDAIDPVDRERVLHAAMTRQVEGSYDLEYRIVRPDGQVRWIRDRAFPVRNATGQVERIVGVARDITDSREVEEQFRQSQKMEALGRLAGGIAHDFNNILAAMSMQAELTLLEEDLPEAAVQGLQEIRSAAQKASSLTRQLLLYSRRQVLQTSELDLNQAVTSLATMLQRIIGEDVHLQLHLHPTPLSTRADVGMLHQVLMNLAANARDAMADGGSLILATGEKMVDEDFLRLNPEAVPGRYVWLSVSDTGGGIPPEILPRIFDPFFTTKEPGKGTGLGLATVFAIVKQHHGWISVFNEPGQGAKFQIFLPAIVGTLEPPVGAAARLQPRGGTETILLAEDEPSVRALTRLLLERHGYRVLEAANGGEALRVWQEHRASVTLLLTDLVMPGGITGKQLARRLQVDKPSLKTVFTSGYCAEIAGRNVELDSGEAYLEKPFSSEQLLSAVRRCLDDRLPTP